MSSLGREILESGTVTDEAGNQYPLLGATRLAQCLFLHELVLETEPTCSLEVGLAHGVSALFICDALRQVGGQKHIVIDRFQHGDMWKGIGLHNLRRAGHHPLVDFYEEPSQERLPKLKDEGTRIDFAYVDTTKLFDAVLTDVYFLTPMLRVGGLLVLDDCTFPGLNKLARFIAVHPSYEPYRKHGALSTHPVQKLLNYVAAIIPSADKIFAPEVAVTNEQLGVDAHCVAFRKVKDDDRHFTWHERF